MVQWNLATQVRVHNSARLDSKTPVMTSSILRIYWFNLLEILIDVGLPSILRFYYTSYREGCVCTVFVIKKRGYRQGRLNGEGSQSDGPGPMEEGTQHLTCYRQQYFVQLGVYEQSARHVGFLANIRSHTCYQQSNYHT